MYTMKEKFIMQRVAGEWVAVSAECTAKRFAGLLRMNDSCAFLLTLLQEEKERDRILARIQEEYRVDPREAAEDLDAIVNRLKDAGLLEEGFV